MRKIKYNTSDERVQIIENIGTNEYIVYEEFFSDCVEIAIDTLTKEIVNNMVVKKIRERYPDGNEEYKMLRLGVLNSENEEFIAYNTYVEECRQWGNSIKQNL